MHPFYYISVDDISLPSEIVTFVDSSVNTGSAHRWSGRLRCSRPSRKDDGLKSIETQVIKQRIPRPSWGPASTLLSSRRSVTACGQPVPCIL